MTDEEQELMARIGRLAGQINRHKNQQAGVQPAQSWHSSNKYPHNQYRHAAAPYPPSNFRANQRPMHRHRTLQLNSTTSSTPSTPSGTGSASDTPGWVARTDRHRQLINAKVYEKDTQNRAKAIEATRKQKSADKRYREKARLHDFLNHQHGASAVPAANSGSNADRNEILISDIRFRVTDGGKKLVKLSDDKNPASATPKTATVAGVKFHRTKNGNMVINRIVQSQRRSGVAKKIDELCKIFSTTGSCPKGPSCRYIHDPNKVAICKNFLKDRKCSLGDSCDLSHDPTPERIPNCLHHAKGHCANPDCTYTHSQALAGAPVCSQFGFYGYCEQGAQCSDRHVFECPDFSNTGRCKTKGCKLPHRERASLLRNQAALAHTGDLSSDEEMADSDDVDSDEVAEFIEADSDDSDFENSKDFIPL